MLSLVLAGGEADITVPLTWSLPGNVQEFDEPELTVLEAKAIALAEEISVMIEIQQDTHYLVAETGLVDKAITVHRLSRLIAVPGIKPGARVSVEAEALLQGGWQPEPLLVRNTTATQFKGDCRLKLSYTVTEDQEVTIFKPTGLDGEIMAETVDVESVEARFAQTLDLSLSVNFENVPVSLAELGGRMTNVKATALSGWVKIEGDLTAVVPYLDESGIAREEKFVYPKKYFVEVSGAAMGMWAEAEGEVEIFTCRREPGAKSGLLRGLLHIGGRLSRFEALDVAVNTRSHQSFFHGSPSHGKHSKKHHHHGKGPFLLEEVVGAGSSQTLIQREIFFDRRVRKVREPVDAQVRNLMHEVIPNKVIVRGVLHKQIFAVDAETGVVFAKDVDENFVHFVDVPGASPGMRVHVNARVEFVKVDIHPGGESARQVTIIEIRVKVTRLIKKDIAVSPVISPSKPVKPLPVKPADKIYIVRSGDTIWKIARMFGVSMESIIAANNLQNPNLIFPGQQLIIPR
jgi:LysM repeat protein